MCSSDLTRTHSQIRTNGNAFSEEMEQLIQQAISETVRQQEECGIDVLTDGELGRENYIHYFLRRLKGVDFRNLTKMDSRDGEWKGLFPTIVSAIQPMDDKSSVCAEWKTAQSYTKKPVKVTLPGPMTIVSSVANNYYTDVAELANTLVLILKREVDRLLQTGCKYIQVNCWA